VSEEKEEERREKKKEERNLSESVLPLKKTNPEDNTLKPH